MQISSEMKTPKINQIINRLFNFSNISDVRIISGKSSGGMWPWRTVGIWWNDGWLWIVLRKISRIAISCELFWAVWLTKLDHLSVLWDECWIRTLFNRTWTDSHWSFIWTGRGRWWFVRGFPGYTMRDTDIFKLVQNLVEGVNNLFMSGISFWNHLVLVLRITIGAHRTWTITDGSSVEFGTRNCSKTEALCHGATSFHSPTCCRFGGQFRWLLSVGSGGLDGEVQTIAELGQAVSRLDYQTKTKKCRKQLFFLKSKLNGWNKEIGFSSGHKGHC